MAPTPPRIQIFHACRCGWKRYITNQPQWMWKKIDHPLYGDVTNMEAAELDVSYHYCPEYRKAILRSPRGQSPLKVNYEQARKVA